MSHRRIRQNEASKAHSSEIDHYYYLAVTYLNDKFPEHRVLNTSCRFDDIRIANFE